MRPGMRYAPAGKFGQAQQYCEQRQSYQDEDEKLGIRPWLANGIELPASIQLTLA